jgi:hypothetical protein
MVRPWPGKRLLSGFEGRAGRDGVSSGDDDEELLQQFPMA